jgi:hypothetical protein
LERIEKESGGDVKFLGRRSYENYLLDAGVLSAVLSSEAQRLGLASVSVEQVDSWIGANKAAFAQKGSAEDWVRTVDASALLDSLFQCFIKCEYKKTLYSPVLTRRLLEAGDPAASELREIVSERFGFE